MINKGGAGKVIKGVLCFFLANLLYSERTNHAINKARLAVENKLEVDDEA